VLTGNDKVTSDFRLFLPHAFRLLLRVTHIYIIFYIVKHAPSIFYRGAIQIWSIDLLIHLYQSVFFVHN